MARRRKTLLGCTERCTGRAENGGAQDVRRIAAMIDGLSNADGAAVVAMIEATISESRTARQVRFLTD